MVKEFFFGFFACLFLISCAGLGFRYYGLADVIYEHGTLLGPTEKEDLPFSKCEPSGNTKHPCVVMFTKDFMAMRLDYEDTKQKLKECQKK